MSPNGSVTRLCFTQIRMFMFFLQGVHGFCLMVVHGFVFSLISGMSFSINYFWYLLMTTDYCENDRYGSANKNEETVIGTKAI
jgi:hypothetical protein